MAGHIHAELMAQYAEDAKTYENPWVLWEYFDGRDWHTFTCTPMWSSGIEHRRKPKTISINGFDVPEPVKTTLNEQKIYFVPSVTDEDLYIEHYWDDDSYDRSYLIRGVIHLTKEAAIQHAKALLSFTERKE